jgi:hypothetical protein
MVANPEPVKREYIIVHVSPQLLPLYTDIHEIFHPLCNLARGARELRYRTVNDCGVEHSGTN